MGYKMDCAIPKQVVSVQENPASHLAVLQGTEFIVTGLLSSKWHEAAVGRGSFSSTVITWGMGDICQLFLVKERSRGTFSWVQLCKCVCLVVKHPSPGEACGLQGSSETTWHFLTFMTSCFESSSKMSLRPTCSGRCCLRWLNSLLCSCLESQKSHFGPVRICQLSKAAVIYLG